MFSGVTRSLSKHEIVDCGAFYEVTLFCISPKNLLGDFFYSLTRKLTGGYEAQRNSRPVERLVGLFYFSPCRSHFVQSLIFLDHASPLPGNLLKDKLSA